MVRRDIRGNEIKPSAWEAGASGSGDAVDDEADSNANVGAKRKGNKGKKQVLMNWG